MIRIVLIATFIGVIYYLFKGASFLKSDYHFCSKCDGLGHWRATRGKKQTCDICKGSGKMPKENS